MFYNDPLFPPLKNLLRYRLFPSLPAEKVVATLVMLVVLAFVVSLNISKFVYPKINGLQRAGFDAKLNELILKFQDIIGGELALDCKLLELPHTSVGGFVAGVVELVVTGGNIRAVDIAALQLGTLGWSLVVLVVVTIASSLVVVTIGSSLAVVTVEVLTETPDDVTLLLILVTGL